MIELNKILSPDQIKVCYRGNFTLPQAALYLGVSEEKVKIYIKTGKLGTNRNGKRISRVECDRLLREDTFYEKQTMKRGVRLVSNL